MPIIPEYSECLDAFKWIENHNPIMNDKQFSLAIKGLRIRARSKDIAHRILVLGQSRQEVIEDTGDPKGGG